MGSNY